MLWPDPQKKLLYDFFDRMNSTNTINHLENLKIYVMQKAWKRIVLLVWDNASFHINKITRKNVIAQFERLASYSTCSKDVGFHI